jgi:hypothetical protein
VSRLVSLLALPTLRRNVFKVKPKVPCRWLAAARILFAGWIAFLSITTFAVSLGGTVADGRALPPALLPAIAGVEAAAAVAFAVSANAIALAGLCATFSAAIVLHAMLGQTAWRLYLYLTLALGFYIIDAHGTTRPRQA